MVFLWCRWWLMHWWTWTVTQTNYQSAIRQGNGKRQGCRTTHNVNTAVWICITKEAQNDQEGSWKASPCTWALARNIWCHQGDALAVPHASGHNGLQHGQVEWDWSLGAQHISLVLVPRFSTHLLFSPYVPYRPLLRSTQCFSFLFGLPPPLTSPPLPHPWLTTPCWHHPYLFISLGQLYLDP